LREWLATELISLVSSGTIAVELALRGVGVQAGDEVIIAGYDFAGNWAAILAVGAVPVVVDVSAGDCQLDVDQLAQAASDRTRTVIASHLHGGMTDMRRLVELANDKGWAIVEDACQCPGAVIESRPAGTWGDAGVFSFGGSKLLTAGRGGAVITNRADVHQRVRLACERGNHAYPLSELQAAVLLPQLDTLAERNARRTQAVARLRAGLSNQAGFRVIESPIADSQPAYYKVGLMLEPPLDSISRTWVSAAAKAEGVALEPGFRDFSRKSLRRCRQSGGLDHSRAAGSRMLVLHHPVLLEEGEVVDRVAEALVKVARLLPTVPPSVAGEWNERLSNPTENGSP
jgi:dTDP-4-amino-4,6-dideoxygalactose transaminase